MTIQKNKQNKKIVALAFYTNQSGDVTHKFNDPNTVLSMASDRLQLKPALDAASKAGFSYEIYSLHSEKYTDVLDLKRVDICLVTKMSANTKKLTKSMVTANLAAIALMKCEGAKVVVQYCDNMLANNTNTIDREINRFYKCIFAMADVVTFPCEKMRKLTCNYLKNETKTFIINDPWQLAKYHIPRKIVPNRRLRLIWFGNNKNITYLLNVINKLILQSPLDMKFLLTIIGSVNAHNAVLTHLRKTGCRSSRWRLRLLEWSEREPTKLLENEIAKSHISLIPSDPEDLLKAGVSHNRLVDSIRGGCVTIASPMDSYLELKDLAIFGNNFGKMLNQAIIEYDFYCDKIVKYRNKQLEKFDPNHNADCWKNFWLNI